MINIMNGSCKNGSQDFQVCEDCLWGQKSPLTLQPMYLSPSSVSSASRTTMSLLLGEALLIYTVAQAVDFIKDKTLFITLKPLV